MRLRYTERSIRHLENIRRYIAADNPRAAERVRARIFASVKMLRTLPRLGHVGRIAGTRELPVAHLPYAIVYRIDMSHNVESGTHNEDELVILGIFHGARENWEDFSDD